MNRALVPLIAVLLALSLGSSCKKKRRPAREDGDAAPGEVAGSDASAAAEPARRPERVVLTRVLIKTVDPERPRELYPRLLAQGIGKQLTDSEWFYGPDDAVPAGFAARRGELQVLITYDVLRDEKSQLRSVMVAVEAELVWEDPDAALPLREKVLFERTLTREVREDEGGILATQVTLAMEAVAVGLIAKEEVRSGPDESVVSALRGFETDAALTLWALEVVRSQKRKSMFDELVAVLDAKNPDVRETAVGVLLALGDRRAVPHLTEKAEMGDRTHLFAVIEAVSTLGGEEAVDFLEFLASGHPDGEVRDRARAGLERLERASPRQR